MKTAITWTLVLVLAGSLAGCQRRSEQHTEDEEGIAVTVWGDRYEVFAEADPLVVGKVSRMRTAAMSPDIAVIPATIHIAPERPMRSAQIPARRAPMAYPRSRHSRYTPTDDARQAGCATSPMAASSVGYTIAVPIPNSVASVANPDNLLRPPRISVICFDEGSSR